MKLGVLMSFAPSGRDWQNLPCVPVSVMGRQIQCSDQSGVMRLYPRDRVRIEEIRGEYVLAAHSGLKGGLLLIAADQLQDIATESTTTQEGDAAL